MSSSEAIAVQEVAQESAPKQRYHRLEVAAVIEETHDSKSVVFSIPEEVREQFEYLPGQFLTLKVPYEGKQLTRCYSLASSPHVDPEHKVTIKRVDGGRISNWINDGVKAGDLIEVMPPAGLFHLTSKTPPGDIVLFGGGSGITPVFSILKSALKTTDRKVKLIYANRDDQSVIFKDEMKAIAAENIDRLEVVHILDSVHGFLTQPMVKQLVEGHENGEYFICGPGPFMDTVESSLIGLGEPRERIHTERFVSPPDPDQAEAAAKEAKAAAEGSITTQFVAELDGEVHEVAYEKGDTLLQAMQKVDLDAPASCEEGMCGACMCMVESGETQLGLNEVLSEAELEEGWTLACQSRPLSNDVKVKFPD
ncbi:ferredoxin--NADP reductase [Endozoicomonas elysicola]|uniref:3-ketosteroid-9-alpha-hydroxylase n=1 Tax=Endozoicomonas elysicola TaxID=305900 RepID=A0A081KA51_9GAMM|nr:ferredoxin--NADP reductase [Endozoicomonas elysicola]KEI71027.1 3-ketosteroid-9-alpha-hydroxylase [Endozoicomonas elysicola]